jgi:hypothetical protein
MVAVTGLWSSVALLFILMVIAVVVGVPFWKICERTGLSPALILLLLIPGAGWIILIWVVALSEWPSVRQSQGTRL